MARAAIAAWMDQFALDGAALKTPVQRFGDPDGAALARVGHDEADLRRRAGDLAGLPILMLSSRNAPIVPEENARRLAGSLAPLGARVDHRVLPGGYGLTPPEAVVSTEWPAAWSAPVP